MSNLSKLKFGALIVTGKNYMPWVLDVKMHLESMRIAQTIVENNDSPPQDKARANIFLRKHIDDGLKFEYLTTEDPSILWKDLKDRFDNQIEVLLLVFREDKRSLQFQDFKKVNECSRFVHNLNSNNELLMKNHQSRPTGSLAYPEVNATKNDTKSFMCGQGQSHGKVHVVKEPTIMLHQTIRLKMSTSASIMVNLAHRRKLMVLALDVVAQTTGQSLVEEPLTSVSFKMNSNGAQHQQKVGDLCIADSGATHTIQKSKKHFPEYRPTKGTIRTISGSVYLIKGTGKANFILPNGTKFLINNAIFSHKSCRNLLSFGDIYLNGYDTQTTTIENKKYLHIIEKSNVLEKLPILHSRLHYTHLSMAESHMVIKEKSCDPSIVSLWHDRLGYPGTTMMKRSSPLKVKKESLVFLERIQGDICGPMHLPCGPFRYFIVLIDASSRWSHVSLLSTCNVAFAKFLAQIIKLRAHFPDYTIKRVRLDNAGEFTSQAFNDYSMSVGIVFEHPVAHVHTQNGLAESLIKRLHLIARPLIMRTKLLISIGGHVILHVASLICMRPSANHVYSPMQLSFGQEPNISHLRIFGCAVYVPIAPPQRTKMGPQRRLGIYVGYEMISIIRYLEPLTGDVFTACFTDNHFNEAIFPLLWGEKKNHEKDVSWSEPSLLYLDPRTKQSEIEVKKIMHMQEIANQLPDAFTDTKRVTKSYIPVVYAPARVEIPDIKSDDKVTQESTTCLKRGRPVGSKDKNPRKRKATENAIIHEDIVLEGTQNVAPPEEEIDDINKEIAINYGHSKISLDQTKTKIINEKFCYNVACDIMNENDEPEPTSVIECQSRHDRNKWKEAMQAELNSLNK
ncbi:disease resistance CC-NBS-LRR class family protein [Tanacetum coccineum]